MQALTGQLARSTRREATMNKMLSAMLAAALLAATQAHADATLINVRGDVRSGSESLAQGQRVFSGATINLGPGAQATLKFEDNMQVVLNENTTLKIADFRYRAQEPGGDRAVLDLLRGALRFVTGIVGARNRNTVALRVPQATIGIRGTDFMVALVNPAFVNVLSGSIAASNSAGTVVFGQAAIGQIATASSLAVPISASALPAAASSAFSNLAAAQVAAATTAGAAGSSSAGAATGAAAAPTAGVGAAVAVGVGIAIIGVAVDDEPSTTTHH
jgi:hypothetical protein